MAQNITLLGASYADVPSVTLPKTGGGTASFTDVSDTTATAADVISGKYFYTAAGVRTEGTGSGGGGVVVTEEADAGGGTIKHITATVISGTKSITANGTGIDVAQYAAVDVAVPAPTPTLQAVTKSYTPTTSQQTESITPDISYDGIGQVDVTVAAMPSGTVTAPSTISGSSASVSTGTNTITLSKTVSVTPSVTTAGYVSSGTAGNSSVSLTASVTTKGATTYTPTTSDQTISSGTYLTGTQTISGDANLVAGNIKSGTTIFGVTGSYTGGGGSATIKSATASTSSNATSISFTGVSASPKMFVCMLDAQSTLGSTRYVIAVDYDGTTTRGTWGYSSSNTRYAYYSNSYFTWSYSGTTLTISTSSSTNGGYFRSGYSYRLIYAY